MSERRKPETMFPGPDESVGDMLRDRRFYTDGAVPPVLFVTVNAIWGLNPAAIAAAAFALAVGVWRIVRRERVIHALSGMFGLAIALLIALKTGEAANYFVPGVITGSIIALAGIVSVLVGRPLTAVLFKLVENKPAEWYRMPRVRLAHVVVTLAWTLLIGGRTALRGYLIIKDQPELLGAQSIVLGLPLTAALAVASWAFLKRFLAGVPEPEAESEPEPELEPEPVD
jgi:hypothetical protein